MKLPVRVAWAMTAGVILGMALAVARVLRVLQASGADARDWSPEGAPFLAFFFGVPLLLGVAVAWWRVFQDRKQRRNRAKPLDLG